jgi:TonB family protein
MKLLFSLLLLVLLALIQPVNAQPTRDWIKFAPTDERFEALLPQPPTIDAAEYNYVSAHGSRSAIGKIYSTSFEGCSYIIWSLGTFTAPSDRVDEIAAFLDDYADFIWESMLKSVRDPLPPTAAGRMSYKSELSMGVIPGREYLLTIGSEVGATRFYLDGARLYVLVALRPRGNSAPIRDFFGGFLAKSPTETPFLQPPATLEANSLDQVFKPNETTTKARVLYKPEPSYTEAARKYSVTGTVVLRGVISTEGRIIGIHVERRLPHGLTEASITAAQRVSFTPATKDGLAVSQSIQLEYNFNLY